MRTGGLRAWLAQSDLVRLYGLFAVLVVALVEIFFSVWKGGYFVTQWYWGVGIISVTLVGAALVPGYFASVGRKQWALAGTLLLLLAVVAASISWSIEPFLSVHETSRTAMYTGAFLLLLPAAAQWSYLIVDAIIFGALLYPAIYGLLQKILPVYVPYTELGSIEDDARASSTVGYHGTFGLMCAMGALLVIARLASFRSISLRALYSALGVLFLVPLYFSFSRGGLLAFVVGALVLLFLSKDRFEVLGNLAISFLPALWVVSQARGYPGLVARPVSLEAIEADGLSLAWLMLVGLLLAFVAQGLFTHLIRAAEKSVPEGVRRGAKLLGTLIVVVVIAGGLLLGWNAFQQAGGVDRLRSEITTLQDPDSAATARDRTNHLTALTSSGRIQQWEIALDNWRKHPLTGTGGNTYQIIYREVGLQYTPGPDGTFLVAGVLYPHSMWMSLLSDDGIFAFLAFAAFCVGGSALACYNVFFGTNSHSRRALLAGSAAAATAYMVSSSIDWNWYIPASTLPFFALTAVLAACAPPPTSSTEYGGKRQQVDWVAAD